MVGIDGRRPQHLVDAGENIAQITVTEIAHVGARERLALPETAARVRKEYKVSGGRQHGFVIPGVRPVRQHYSRRASMHGYNQRIPARRVVAPRIEQPALHAKALVHPVHALGFAPIRVQLSIHLRHLLPLTDRTGPNFRWMTC